MIINFVGNYQSGYVGEVADETHLARELTKLGHTVRKIARDEWREHVLQGKEYPSIPKDLRADINIIAKWHHFYDGRFIAKLREESQAPVFYWVWDMMFDKSTFTFPDWHLLMAKEADLYLSGEYGLSCEYKREGVRHYYFQFDVADGDINVFPYATSGYKRDVAFFGSMVPKGHRKDWLVEINKKFPIEIFSWNYEEWAKLGFYSHPAVYGEEFNKTISETRITLGFSVENDCWGYWSNRIGKTLLAGGFLLYEFTPGMEIFYGDNIEYFGSVDEAVHKIGYYLKEDSHREKIRRAGQVFGRKNCTSEAKIKQLAILMERFLRGNPKSWKL